MRWATVNLKASAEVLRSWRLARLIRSCHLLLNHGQLCLHHRLHLLKLLEANIRVRRKLRLTIEVGLRNRSIRWHWLRRLL